MNLNNFKTGDCMVVADYYYNKTFSIEIHERNDRSKFAKCPQTGFCFDKEDLAEYHILQVLAQYTAFDKQGRVMCIGMRVYYPIAKGGAGNGACFKEGEVVKIHEPSHRGYGYWTRKLGIKDKESGKIITHNFPANCMVL